VAPGAAVGLDINAEDIRFAQRYATEQGSPNVRFETATVYELPYADASFDAVFSHALLEHLREPLRALQEMHRVLKPGGVLGVRAPDYAGNLIAPEDPQVTRFWELYERLARHNGGNPRIGKHLRALLREAGFTAIESSASYDCWPTGDGHALAEPPFVAQWLALGWIDQAEWETLRAALAAWHEQDASRSQLLSRRCLSVCYDVRPQILGEGVLS
jgi:SAM-dependent methyltransferase